MSTNSVATIQNSETNKTSPLDVHSVASIIPYSKGFIAACGKGKAFLYEKNDEKEYFRKIRDIKIPSDQYSNDPSKNVYHTDHITVRTFFLNLFS